MIRTASALGFTPLVDRVHYDQTDIDLDQHLQAHELLSDVIWVCDDYQEPDPFYVELRIVTVDRADAQRLAPLQGFETLASTARAIFPVALPSIALGEGVLDGFTKLLDTADRRETFRISEPLRLFPPRTPRAKTIRSGQYVIMSEPVDASHCELGDNAQLTAADGADLVTKEGRPISYAVIRIDPVKDVQIDFVIAR